MIDKLNFNLLSHNTFGIDVNCQRFIEFSSVDELQELSTELKKTNLPVLIIGGGSNLLFLKDFDGIVLHSAIKGVEVIEETSNETMKIRCGSGETWDDIVRMCVERGWYGAENLSLIPGEVGATAIQNIGAYGVEVKDVIDEVEIYDIETDSKKTFTNKECQYAYRDSIFKHKKKGKYVVTHVTYRLSKTFRPILDYGNIRKHFDASDTASITAKQVREFIIETRNAKLPDPKVTGNAGSFFKNPIVGTSDFHRIEAQFPDAPHYIVDSEHIKIPAGWLIEQCGWKGRSKGKAAVHDRQALVLINKGGATGQEIYNLAKQIIEEVSNKFGITISPEVNIIG